MTFQMEPVVIPLGFGTELMKLCDLFKYLMVVRKLDSD